MHRARHRHVRRSTALLLAAAALAAAVGDHPLIATTLAGPPEPDPGAPNVLLVVLDDLGYGDAGAYGSRSIPTPNIDRIAAEGIRFDRFYANAANCSPTRASLLTGQYPHRTGTDEIVTRKSYRGIPPDVVCLPATLAAAGYDTAHIGKWHVGQLRDEYLPEHPSKGFAHSTRYQTSRSRPYSNPIELVAGAAPRQLHGHLTELSTDAAIRFIESPRDGPFFLNLWYQAPHEPNAPPRRWARRFPRTPQGQYAALVAHVDEQIGRLLAALADNGLASDTLVIVLSDNGGSHRNHRRNGDLLGFKTHLLEGGIRVPMVARWPAAAPAGTVCDEVVAGFDLYPTLAELAGVDPATIDARGLDGRSLAATLRGEAAGAPRGPLHWERDLGRRPGRKQFAVIDGAWKLVGFRGRMRLHDVTSPRPERRGSDVAADNPEVVADLLARHREWLRDATRIPLAVDALEGDAAAGPEGSYTFGEEGGAVTYLPNLRTDFHDSDFALHLRVRPSGSGESAVLATRNGSWTLSRRADGRLQLEMLTDRGRRLVLRGRRGRGLLEAGREHDVGFRVFGFRKEQRRARLELFLDGARLARRSLHFAAAPSTSAVRLGSDPAGGRALSGGEIRDVAAYTTPLDPAAAAR